MKMRNAALWVLILVIGVSKLCSCDKNGEDDVHQVGKYEYRLYGIVNIDD